MNDRWCTVFLGRCGCIVAAQVIRLASDVEHAAFVAEHDGWDGPHVWTSQQVREARVYDGCGRPHGGAA
jgi:hypothetical protein